MTTFKPRISSDGRVLICRDCGQPLRQIRIRLGILGEVIETQGPDGSTACPKGSQHSEHWGAKE